MITTFFSSQLWKLVRSQACVLYVSGMWTTCLSLPRGMESILEWKLGGLDYSEKAVTVKRQLAGSAPDLMVM